MDYLVRTAGLEMGTRVLEVGCGTGQLTEHLAALGLELTAIDIGASMVAVARRRTTGAPVTFLVTSFEDFTATGAPFELLVFGDSFHWIDPEHRFAKSAHLLRPGGWLAVLSLQQRYDEPLGTALRQMWVARSDDGDDWLSRPALSISQTIADSRLFRDPLEASYSTRLRMRADTVLGLENTRATSLGWDVDDRRAFTDELRRYLSAELVGLTQEAAVTMAQVASRPDGSAPMYSTGHSRPNEGDVST